MTGDNFKNANLAMGECRKPAAACESLTEVREQIDRIDKQIVALIAERSAYVRRVVSFKQSKADIPAPQRAEEVVRKVKKLAEELDADSTVVERVYREMIAAFIEAEMAEISARPLALHSLDSCTVRENA